jgi:hypothetical protein
MVSDRLTGSCRDGVGLSFHIQPLARNADDGGLSPNLFLSKPRMRGGERSFQCWFKPHGR